MPEDIQSIHRAGQRDTISPERLAGMIEATSAYEKFPYGLQLSEIRAQDIEAALRELQEYRQGELRPTDKFLANTLDQQMQHIEQEFNEAKEAAMTPIPSREAAMHLAEELTDLKTSCETMLAIMGLNAADRRAEVRKVNAKNERRNYFDRSAEQSGNVGELEAKIVSDLEKLTGQKWGRE